MSTDRETTRIVRSWLKTDEYESADRVLDAVLDRIDATPQRRATGWPARRFPEMNNAAKLALGAVAVVVVALVGIRLLMPGTLSLGGDPESTATRSPTTSPNQLPENPMPLDVGLYWLGPEFPVELTFEPPAGWFSCSEGSLEQGVCRRIGASAAPQGVGIGFLIVENVVADPCVGTDLLDPPVGPSIDDLATAVSNLPGFEVTTAEDVSVDGFDAKRLTITAPEDAGCGLSTWATPTRTNGVGAGEANLLYIVDVDGVRVMINAAYFPAHVSREELAAVEEAIASIRIEP